jgi:hypothetical protein
MDASAPLEAFAALREITVRTQRETPALAEVTRQVFTGIYRPIVPGQYDWYT